ARPRARPGQWRPASARASRSRRSTRPRVSCAVLRARRTDPG
ncbi:hypothetical protein HMPREF1550_01177, partial [Actinomyces sp. oral taxon 877 str. F0543]